MRALFLITLAVAFAALISQSAHAQGDFNDCYRAERALELGPSDYSRMLQQSCSDAKSEHAVKMADLDRKSTMPMPTIGMSAQQMLNGRWGQPSLINTTTSKNGLSEQWVYRFGRDIPPAYVYLIKGRVVAIQN